MQEQFTYEDQVALTLLIIAINDRNRIQVGFGGANPVIKRKRAKWW